MKFKKYLIDKIYSNQRFVFCALYFTQILSGLLNENVEEVEEALIGLWHDFLIHSSVFQRLGGVSCPQDLNAKQSDLSRIAIEKLDKIEVVRVRDSHVGGSYHTVERLLRCLQ